MPYKREEISPIVSSQETSFTSTLESFDKNLKLNDEGIGKYYVKLYHFLQNLVENQQVHNHKTHRYLMEHLSELGHYLKKMKIKSLNWLYKDEEEIRIASLEVTIPIR